MNSKKKILNLLKEEYDNRINMFMHEVSVEREGNVILDVGTKLKDRSGCLWSVLSKDVIVNSNKEKCLKLKREGSLAESNKAEKSPTKTIHPRKSKEKVSVEIDVNADVKEIEEFLLKDDEYLIPFTALERMFTL